MSTSSVTASEVIKSIADGITDIKKDQSKLKDIGVMAKVKFGDSTDTFTMQVGGSPTITFDKPSSGSTSEQQVDYLVRMAIADASFSNPGSKEICVERASFYSQVTPGAEFALTYELMSYCKPELVSTKDKCIIFTPKSKVEFILPYYERCSSIPSQQPDEQAQCICKALRPNKKFTRSSNNHSSSPSSDKSNTSASASSSSSATPSSLADPAKGSSAHLTSPHLPTSFLLIFLLLWSLGLFKRH